MAQVGEEKTKMNTVADARTQGTREASNFLGVPSVLCGFGSRKTNRGRASRTAPYVNGCPATADPVRDGRAAGAGEEAFRHSNLPFRAGGVAHPGP